MLKFLLISLLTSPVTPTSISYTVEPEEEFAALFILGFILVFYFIMLLFLLAIFIYSLVIQYKYFEKIGSKKPWKVLVPFASLHEKLKIAKMSNGWLYLSIASAVILLIWLPFFTITILTESFFFFSILLILYILALVSSLIVNVVIYIVMYRIVKTYNGRDSAIIFIILQIFTGLGATIYMHAALLKKVKRDDELLETDIEAIKKERN